jgi:hypothetical protein
MTAEQFIFLDKEIGSKLAKFERSRRSTLDMMTEPERHMMMTAYLFGMLDIIKSIGYATAGEVLELMRNHI